MVYLNRFLQQGTEMKAQEMRLDVRYIDDTTFMLSYKLY